MLRSTLMGSLVVAVIAALTPMAMTGVVDLVSLTVPESMPDNLSLGVQTRGRAVVVIEGGRGRAQAARCARRDGASVLLRTGSDRG